MAVMYPPEPYQGTKSAAEIKLFRRIKTQLADDWIALHSVGLTHHPQKPWAEIDYVLVGPTGVFCLEVKGGRIRRQDGRWEFTDRDDRTSIKHEGPFAQVGSASSALYKHLGATIPITSNTATGYGVVMPDIEFKETGPDIEPAILYDLRDENQPFGIYVRRLSNYWQNRLELQRHRPLRSLTREEREAILEVLRGDFDLRPSLQTRIGAAKEDLLRLTNEQYRVLDALRDNERVLIKGGAGTGKTLLAVEEARRQGAQGRQVLLCCYNRRLAAFLRDAVRDLPRVHVWHLHGLAASLVAEAKLEHRLPSAEEEDLFAVFYPQTAIEALFDLDRLQSYDVLIIDEAQDVLRDTYVDLLDALLKNGLGQGQWKVFLDHNQDIFSGVAPEGLKRFQNAQPATFRLSVNCRNTVPIAVATQLLSGSACEEILKVGGPDVEHAWYRDERHQARQIAHCLNRLLSEGVSYRDIAILSRYRLENSAIANGIPGVPYPLADTERITGEAPMIRFATVGSFKGLESDVVLLIDIDDLEDRSVLRLLYVGASRAQAYLALFIHEAERPAYDRQAFEYGRALATRPIAGC